MRADECKVTHSYLFHTGTPKDPISEAATTVYDENDNEDNDDNDDDDEDDDDNDYEMVINFS